jgi:hypothetical protein
MRFVGESSGLSLGFEEPLGMLLSRLRGHLGSECRSFILGSMGVFSAQDSSLLDTDDCSLKFHAIEV